MEQESSAAHEDSPEQARLVLEEQVAESQGDSPCDAHPVLELDIHLLLVRVVDREVVRLCHVLQGQQPHQLFVFGRQLQDAVFLGLGGHELIMADVEEAVQRMERELTAAREELQNRIHQHKEQVI